MRRYKNSCIAHYAPVIVPCIRTKILRQLNNLFRTRLLVEKIKQNLNLFVSMEIEMKWIKWVLMVIVFMSMGIYVYQLIESVENQSNDEPLITILENERKALLQKQKLNHGLVFDHLVRFQESLCNNKKFTDSSDQCLAQFHKNKQSCQKTFGVDFNKMIKTEDEHTITLQLYGRCLMKDTYLY